VRKAWNAAAALAAAVLLEGFPAVAGTSASGGKPSLVKWRSVEKGEAESRSTKKPVLYFFTADWCGPCRLLKETVFSEQRAAEIISKHYVPVEVDDRSRETGKLAPELERLGSRFGLRGFPTLVVARPDKGKAVSAEGWVGKDRSYEFLSLAGKRLVELEKERQP
jgi:thiol:disulfide interchange protein